MHSDDFADEFPGCLVPTKLGSLAYVPNDLPPSITLTPELNHAHERALVALGALDAIIPSLPNPHLIMRREAVLSSKIEGTQTELTGLLVFEEAITGTDSDGNAILMDRDAREVHNYVEAHKHGFELLKTLPVCVRLIKKVHSKLMDRLSDGGIHIRPGEYRDRLAFMGSNDLLSARYVAPPESEIDGLMDRLEKYINAPKVIPTLVDIAIIHYQFEAIHPFGDGNGRLGRLLISMLLATREMLSEPVLYLSAYFERHKMEYVTRMWRISSAGEWADWIKFFLAGVKSEAQDLSAKAKRLLVLREDLRKELQKKQSAAKQLQLLDSLFRWPIITVNRAAQLLGMTHQGATKHIQSFQKKGILKEVTGNDRNRMYIAVPIVELLS